MLLRAVTSKSLRLMIGNYNTACSFIREAISMKHIRENELIFKKQKAVIKIRYYQITKAGMRFMMNCDDVAWLEAIRDIDLESYIILEPQYYVKENMIRYLNYTTLLILCKAAGIKLSKQVVLKSSEAKNEIVDDEEVQKKKTVNALLNDNTDDDYWENANDLFESAGMDVAEFHGKEELKSVLAGNISADNRSFSFGRMKGILDSEHKSALAYVAGIFIMRWDAFNTLGESAALTMWNVAKSKVPLEKRRNIGKCGILVVESPNDFGRIYKYKFAKREEQIEFGKPLDHLYLIPNSKQGAGQLKWIMSSDDESENEALASRAIESGNFDKNDIRSKMEFQLRNLNNAEVALGFQLDIKRMNVIKKVAESHEDDEFFILCFDWQMPFYKEIMPENVKYYTLKN